MKLPRCCNCGSMRVNESAFRKSLPRCPVWLINAAKTNQAGFYGISHLSYLSSGGGGVHVADRGLRPFFWRRTRGTSRWQWWSCRGGGGHERHAGSFDVQPHHTHLLRHGVWRIWDHLQPDSSHSQSVPQRPPGDRLRGFNRHCRPVAPTTTVPQHPKLERIENWHAGRGGCPYHHADSGERGGGNCLCSIWQPLHRASPRGKRRASALGQGGPNRADRRVSILRQAGLNVSNNKPERAL